MAPRTRRRGGQIARSISKARDQRCDHATRSTSIRITAEEVKARDYNLDIKNPHTIADDHGDPETLLVDLARTETETAGLRDQLKAILADASRAMNAERLLKHYEQIADAPGAIARLRRFVLNLAVRGKLVPQDAKDEPATELLKRIGRKKARLVKMGEIRTPKASEPILDDELPIPLPQSWASVISRVSQPRRSRMLCLCGPSSL